MVPLTSSFPPAQPWPQTILLLKAEPRGLRTRGLLLLLELASLDPWGHTPPQSFPGHLGKAGKFTPCRETHAGLRDQTCSHLHLRWTVPSFSSSSEPLGGVPWDWEVSSGDSKGPAGRASLVFTSLPLAALGSHSPIVSAHVFLLQSLFSREPRRKEWPLKFFFK